MNVLIIARGYPSEKHKRNGIFEFDQAKALACLGHKVVYAAVDMRSIRKKRTWGFESFERDGVSIEVFNIPIGAISQRILRTVGSIGLKKLYKKILEKHEQPDVIHAHFIGIGYTAVKVFENHKMPLVLTEHSSEMNQNSISPYMLKLGHYTYPRVNTLITVSDHLAKNLKEKFDVNPMIIPNIVDLENFHYKYKEKKSLCFNFVSTGNLVTNKRMGYLIDAFYKAFGSNKEVYLYIFGEGPEEISLKALINKYKMENQIIMMGQVDRKLIAKQMELSHCFVLASRSETFGVAYIEAMAMGLPVIATKCGGPESFINSKNGVLVSLYDIDDLISAMVYMYNNVENYDNDFIAKQTQSQYSSNTIARSLTELYTNIL